MYSGQVDVYVYMAAGIRMYVCTTYIYLHKCRSVYSYTVCAHQYIYIYVHIVMCLYTYICRYICSTHNFHHEYEGRYSEVQYLATVKPSINKNWTQDIRNKKLYLFTVLLPYINHFRVYSFYSLSYFSSSIIFFPSTHFKLNLQAPCVLYIGQAFRYSPENTFYIFNQQIYIIRYLLDRASLI